MNNDKELSSGMKYSNYHTNNANYFNGMQNSKKGSQFDNMVKFIDGAFFTTRQNLDRIKASRSLDNCEGYMLDDWGGDLSTPRENGWNDDIYRFMLKSRIMSRKSKGTINDLIDMTAHLLGCSPHDIFITKDRKWVGNQLQGEPRTLKVVDIPYSKVKNMFTLDYLVQELQKAAVSGTQIKFISFAVQADFSLNMQPYNTAATSISCNFNGKDVI